MDQPSTWFDDPALLEAEVRRSFEAQTTPALPRLPGYDDLRYIARGGQGLVYRAVQRSTNRPVAIKILMDGELASGPARRRFEREIELVARLNHPNIVRVYDSGSLDDGRLFLVMEYVDGVPLDVALAPRAVDGSEQSAQPASLRSTLELFATVCEAVEAAHQRGIIHRDLKPSNIRVDAAGRPLVLDFGIAKLTDSASDLRTVTEGQFVGSLPWASPEQVSGGSDAMLLLGMSSDVYSLGVILYQLLTGRFPYSVTGDLAQIVDNIQHAEPEPIARFCPQAGSEVAAIVARALSKESARRYQSAGELGRDIRRYLAGEPVEARLDSAWYSLRKSLRRHRWPVGTAAAIAVTLLVSFIVVTGLWRQTLQEKNRTAIAAAQAAALNEFLIGMLSAVDPDRADLEGERGGRGVTVLELLDLAASDVPLRFGDHPAVQVDIHRTLRDMYAKLGQFQQAQKQAENAVEVLSRSHGATSPQTLVARREVAGLIHKKGQSEAAAAHYAEILEQQRSILPADHADILQTLIDFAQSARALGRNEEAEAMLRTAIEADSRRIDPDEEAQHRHAAAIERLGAVMHDLGRHDEAEALYREALARWDALVGPLHSYSTVSLNNLAVLLMHLGRQVEAEPILRRLLEGSEERNGEDHPSTLTAVQNLGKIIGDLGRLEEAEILMRRAVEGRIRILGEDHPHTLVSMNNLATIAASMGGAERLAEAESLHRRILQARRGMYSGDHLDIAITLTNLGRAVQVAGRPQDALPYAVESVEMSARLLGEEHWITAALTGNLARVRAELGEHDQARALFTEAHRHLVAALGPDHPQTTGVARALSDLPTETKRDSGDPR